MTTCKMHYLHYADTGAAYECGRIRGHSGSCVLAACPPREERPSRSDDYVNHPAHYGGADNPYEAIKVIRAWKLGFSLGNTVKYIARAEHKGAATQDLEKALWYLSEEIAQRKQAKQ